MNLAINMYKENILENYKNPQNFGKLPTPTHMANSINKSCGDEIHITMNVEKDIIKNINFQGKACAICTASASLLTEDIKNKKLDQVLKLNRENVLELLEIPISPVRLKCALLPLETVQKAIMENK